MMIDDDSYGLGYEAGFSDGRNTGYTEGWEDAAHDYEERIGRLMAEVRLMEARVNVLSKKTGS